MSSFRKTAQKFFIYFFTSVSVLIIVLGISRVKKEGGALSVDNGSPTNTTDTSGMTVTDSAYTTKNSVRGATQQATFTGKTYQTPWGNLATAIKVKDGKIVAVTIPTLPDSPPSIYAEPYLIEQALKSGTANIQSVSGATYTSRAFKASLESALAQAVADLAPSTQASIATNGANTTSNQSIYSAPEPSTRVSTSLTQTQPTSAQNTNTAKTSTGVTGTFTGNSAQTPWGSAVAAITVTNGKITGVSMPQVPNSPPSIQAEPYLVQQALAAGSANIQGVSGATYTSLAFKTSLESAIARASAQGSVTPGPVSSTGTSANTTSAYPTQTTRPSIPRSYNNDEWNESRDERDHENDDGYDD